MTSTSSQGHKTGSPGEDLLTTPFATTASWEPDIEGTTALTTDTGEADAVTETFTESAKNVSEGKGKGASESITDTHTPHTATAVEDQDEVTKKADVTPPVLKPPKTQVSSQDTDSSDFHFKPKHSLRLNKGVRHQETSRQRLNTNALEEFIKGDPMEPAHYEEPSHRSRTRDSSASKHRRPSSKHHPSHSSTPSSGIVHSGNDKKYGSTIPHHSTFVKSVTDVTKSSKAEESSSDPDLGQEYTTSVQEAPDIEPVTELAQTLQDLDALRNSTSQESGVKEQIAKLKSQVHSATQDDDGEYEYGEQVLDTEDDDVLSTEDAAADNDDNTEPGGESSNGEESKLSHQESQSSRESFESEESQSDEIQNRNYQLGSTTEGNDTSHGSDGAIEHDRDTVAEDEEQQGESQLTLRHQQKRKTNTRVKPHSHTISTFLLLSSKSRDLLEHHVVLTACSDRPFCYKLSRIRT